MTPPARSCGTSSRTSVKLHLRLALPLFLIAIGVTLAGTVGVVILVRRTMAIALAQNGAQLGQITENILRGRSRGLNRVAATLAASRPPWTRADLAAGRLDAAVIVDQATGRVRSTAGRSLAPEDLRGMAVVGRPARGAGPSAMPSGPLLLSGGGNLMIAGVAVGPSPGTLVVAAQALGPEFARALKETLQAEVLITSGTVLQSSTLSATVPEGNYLPSTLNLRTPGGVAASLVILIPARGARGARRAALTATVVGGLVLLGLALLFYNYAVARITRPVEELIAAADRIAAGDLAARLPAGAPAELGALVRQFNAMATALKDTQEKLIHSAKLSSVGALVAGVSHELNNPLLGLLGHAEYLSGKLPPGAPGREELDIILEEGNRMKRILADLRGFVRPGGGDRTRLDANRIVEEVLVLVRHQAGQAGVRCEAVLAPGGVPIHASADQLRQVLLNLAVNALQAMPSGGGLVIRTGRRPEAAGALAHISVEDSGTGIAAEHLERVTEPFFSTRPGRMGLGLAISQEVATRHGGTLVIDSAPGRGTRILLALPLAE